MKVKYILVEVSKFQVDFKIVSDISDFSSDLKLRNHGVINSDSYCMHGHYMYFQVKMSHFSQWRHFSHYVMMT